MKKFSVDPLLGVFLLMQLSLFIPDFAMGQAPSSDIKTVVVDWDKLVFQQALPFEETFLLEVRSDSVPRDASGKADSLVLVRFRDRPLNFTFYYVGMKLVKDWE